jgi:hypothetical protein
MDLIKPQEVIRRVEGYFQGGVIKYLSLRQRLAGQRGIEAASRNTFDQQPLNLSSAGIACEQFIKTIPIYPDRYDGRGIVICGGGIKYFTNAWVCVNMLRQLGCTLPIQFWYLGNKEMDSRMKTLVAPLGVECVDAIRVRKKFPVRLLNGWALKPYAILHSPYREVLLLDADNVPVVNPEFLFATPEFHATGAIFWPDFLRGRDKKAIAIWRSFGLQMPNELEFETGQIVLDKQRCWEALCLSVWANENADFFYRHLHGDKETFHLAFRKLKTPYALIQKGIHPLEGTMCQHDFLGRRIFQHRNTAKWDLLFNKRVKGFWFEKQCHGHLAELKRVWNGTINSQGISSVPAGSKPIRRPIRIEALMTTCAERNEVRRQTLHNLARTDWGNMPIHIHFDTPSDGTPLQRQRKSFYVGLKRSLDFPADYILFLEDDLEFNKHILHNICNWAPVRFRAVALASLYNPGHKERAVDIRNNARIIDAKSIFGSQAFLLSKETVDYIVQRWGDAREQPDVKIPRLVDRLGKPILFHAPSLVQHLVTRSTWGGGGHQALDFDPVWKAQP